MWHTHSIKSYYRDIIIIIIIIIIVNIIIIAIIIIIIILNFSYLLFVLWSKIRIYCSVILVHCRQIVAKC